MQVALKYTNNFTYANNPTDKSHETSQHLNVCKTGALVGFLHLKIYWFNFKIIILQQLLPTDLKELRTVSWNVKTSHLVLKKSVHNLCKHSTNASQWKMIQLVFFRQIICLYRRQFVFLVCTTISKNTKNPTVLLKKFELKKWKVGQMLQTLKRTRRTISKKV